MNTMAQPPRTISLDQRILCICRGGQVRSVAARNILNKRFGFNKVICCGWEMNDKETLTELSYWADVILVVGRGSQWNLDLPAKNTILIEIGEDIWGRYDHPELIRILHDKLEALVA